MPALCLACRSLCACECAAHLGVYCASRSCGIDVHPKHRRGTFQRPLSNHDCGAAATFLGWLEEQSYSALQLTFH